MAPRPCLILAALLPLAAIAADKPLVITSKIKLDIGKETTFLTEPLRDDGTVEYLAALNKHFGQGLTEKNNAWPHLLALAELDNIVDDGTLGLTRKAYPVEKPKILFRFFHDLGDDIDDVTWTPWKASEFPVVAEWLRYNDAPMAAIAEACKMEHFYAPRWSRDGSLQSAKPPALSFLRKYAYAFCYRAMLHLGQGDAAASRDDLLTIHRLGRLLSRGASPDERFVGYAIDSLAFRVDCLVAGSGELTAADVAAYRQNLEKLPDLGRMWEAEEFFNRCAMLDAAIQIARNGQPALRQLFQDIEWVPKPDTAFSDEQLLSVDYSALLRTINKAFDDRVAAMKLSAPARRQAAFAAIGEDLHGRLKKWDKELTQDKNLNQAFQDYFLACFMSGPDDLAEHEQAARLRADMTGVALALAAYHARHHAYPDSLDTLVVEKFLEKLPTDPYNANRPLKYLPSPDGFRIYSVGKDGKDDGGKPRSTTDIVMQSSATEGKDK